jgi:hypothetical protein
MTTPFVARHGALVIGFIDRANVATGSHGHAAHHASNCR